MRNCLIYAAAIVFAVTLVVRFKRLGGPYFEHPTTIQDHVNLNAPSTRDVILLARAAAEAVPRGARVTALHPSNAPNYDSIDYLTAAGMMPRHRVVAQTFGDRATEPEFVLAVGGMFSNPDYHLYREFAAGRVYEINR